MFFQHKEWQEEKGTTAHRINDALKGGRREPDEGRKGRVVDGAQEVEKLQSVAWQREIQIQLGQHNDVQLKLH